MVLAIRCFKENGKFTYCAGLEGGTYGYFRAVLLADERRERVLNSVKMPQGIKIGNNKKEPKTSHKNVFKGLFTWRWGTPGR